MRIPRLAAVLLTVLAIAPTARAQLASFVASRDNTLYENATGQLSDGVGPFFYVGKTGDNAGNLVRRGLLAFDLSSVPTNAVVGSAVLTLTSSKTGFAGPADIELYRVTKDWGEGTSNAGDPGGGGALATTDDATWIHNKYSGSLWDKAGGDFNPVLAAFTSVATPAKYNFAGTVMLLNIQNWVNDPATNFGWELIGDEATSNTAKRFASHDNPTAADRPVLSISYSVAPEPGTLGLLATFVVPALSRRRARR